MKNQSLAESILTSSGKFHIELGLGRIKKILELLGNPEKDLNIIHIAGSNGKGSTCAILEEIFVQAGFKTGKFTRPHLFSYTERITVNKLPISDLEFDFIVEKISALDEEFKIELTEFEILTAAGFLYFKEKACDIVILETGLGGRLDSTNVIEKPLVSIITSISLEHKERLGDTIEKIAAEKTGIVKKGCPVVFLKENKAYKTLARETQKRGGIIHEAEAIEIEDNCAIINGENIEFALKGRHQGENLALALKAVEVVNKSGVLSLLKNRGCSGISVADAIDFNTVKKALSSVRWRFRLEETDYNGTKILVDACHNPDGARVLAEYLDENYKNKRIKFIFGCLKNKDYRKVLGYLFGGDENYFTVPCSAVQKSVKLNGRELCFYEFDYPNALKYEDLPPEIKEVAKKSADPFGEMSDAGADLVVVCGSIYMLGQIFKDFY